ncbi:MAG TPA: hypothetical protein VH085_05700 [Nocardioides sp.]|nr:hypothetical protein [Nocardioides sp.]
MRKTLTVLTALVGLVAPLSLLGSAHADITGFGDSLRNRQIKHLNVAYQRVCPSCKEGAQPRNEIPKVASGTAKFDVATYKILDQNQKYDFYALDVSSDLVKRTGDQDWGWMDVTVRSTGSTRIVDSSFSRGVAVQNVSSCTRFPINLGVSFKGVGVSTTVGHVSFCHHGSKMTDSHVSDGRMYHATGLSGIASLTGQRYVQVPQGATPTFRVKVSTNADTLQCPSVSNGTQCFVGHGMHAQHLDIGTTVQH